MTVIVVPAAELHRAAEWAARAIPTKTVTPILMGMLVEADGAAETVTLSGFNYDIRASVTVDALVKNPGRALLPGRLLVDVAGVAERGVDMRIDVSGSVAEVRAGRARWTVPTLPLEDYPHLPEPGELVGTVDAEEFRRAVARVVPAADRHSPTPMLTGVRIETDGTELTLAATDRYRLAAATIPWAPAGDTPLEALVPVSLLEIAARGINTGPVALHVGWQGQLFGAATATRVLTGRQLDEEYPPWRKLIPGHQAWSATLEVAALTRALKQVAMVPERVPQVQLAVGDGTLQVWAGIEGQTAEVPLEAATEGDAIQINMSGAYLKDALDAVDAEQVRIQFDGSRRPVLITGDDPDTYKHLVMPVRG